MFSTYIECLFHITTIIVSSLSFKFFKGLDYKKEISNKKLGALKNIVAQCCQPLCKLSVSVYKNDLLFQMRGFIMNLNTCLTHHNDSVLLGCLSISAALAISAPKHIPSFLCQVSKM
jgi:hypothetical protein